MIYIDIDYTALKRAKELLKKIPYGFIKAQKMATRRAMESMRTVASRKIPEIYYIKPGRVKKAISLSIGNKATGGLFIVRGQRLSLSSFYMTPKKLPVRKGLKAAVRRDTGIKTIEKGFLIRGKNSGKMLPFVRIGRERTAIKHLVSPAIPQMIEKNEDVQEAILEAGEEAFMKNFSFWVNKISSTGFAGTALNFGMDFAR